MDAEDVDFEFRLIKQSIGNILFHYKDSFVQVDNLYDLRAVGPEKYVDYMVISHQLQSELKYLLEKTLPRIKQLREKIDSSREEVVEAITDHPDSDDSGTEYKPLSDRDSDGDSKSCW